MARYPMPRSEDATFFAWPGVLPQFAPELHLRRGQHSLLHRLLILLLLGFALSISACEPWSDGAGADIAAAVSE
jgi:predicted small secreted protein